MARAGRVLVGGEQRRLEKGGSGLWRTGWKTAEYRSPELRMVAGGRVVLPLGSLEPGFSLTNPSFLKINF